MPGRVPDRWEEYEPMGKPIIGTNFIAFKVPLEEGICRRLPSSDLWFTPNDLFARLAAEKMKMGLVIDLTNTNRYYKPEVLKEYGVRHIKIFTEGKAVPKKKVKSQFFRAVDNFLAENRDNGRLIGVHCTHGLNRTGYLICRYMIDKLNFTADAAIQAFNTARGYGIEREEYLEALRKAASEGLEEEGGDSQDDHGTQWSNSRNGQYGNQYWDEAPRHATPTQGYSNSHYQAREPYRSRERPSRSDWDNNWREHSRAPARHSASYSQSPSNGKHQNMTNDGYGQRYQPYGSRNKRSDDSYGQFGRSYPGSMSGRQNGHYDQSRNSSYGQKPSYQYSNRGQGQHGGYGQFGRCQQDYGQFGRRPNKAS